MKKHLGFTLIELLVVIAIIGVLSSVVLASLSNARDKGKDGNIRSNLSHLRASAEIAYANLSYTYGTQVYSSACGAIAYVAPFDHIFEDTAVQSVIDGAVAQSGVDAKCNAGGTYYVVAVRLKTDTSKGWCVDSLGNSRRITWTDYTAALSACPAAT